MSTQSAKNLIRTQLESVLARAKVRIEEEGRKKLNELKEKLPTPQSLLEKLKADINSDSCSEKGKEKFERIYNQILNPINKIEKLIKESIQTIESIEEKIDEVLGETGPVGKLNKIPQDLEPLISTLNTIVMAAPALLAVLKGPTADVQTGDIVVTNREKAIAKIAEYAALFTAIPMIIQMYIAKAEKVKQPIALVKNKLTFVRDEIIKIKAFLYSLLLQFNTECTAFEAYGDEFDADDGTIPNPEDPTELDVYLGLLKDQFNAVYQQFQLAGKTRAWERVYKLKPDFTEDYNVKGHIINPQNVNPYLPEEES